MAIKCDQYLQMTHFIGMCIVIECKGCSSIEYRHYSVTEYWLDLNTLFFKTIIVILFKAFKASTLVPGSSFKVQPILKS